MENSNRTWAEVSLDALYENYKTFRGLIDKKTKLMAVVKADAYGHGVEEVSRTLQSAGADYLGVAFFDEAKQIRESGIELPVLILGYTSTDEAIDIVKMNITPTVYNFSMAKAISNAAQRLNKIAKIHIKIDTGMCRIGYQYYGGMEKSTVDAICDLAKLPNIEIEGIFSHFSKADEEDTAFTELQFKRFTDLIKELENKKIYIPIKHICNSAATIRFPDMQLDMVRVGISLYGIYPSDIDYGIKLKPVMSLKTMITNIKHVPKGECVSYGGIYEVTEDKKIATIPIGYADGFSRILSGKAKVIVGKNFAPDVGKICMDQCMIDVTNVNNINIEEEIVIFGSSEGLSISPDDIAKSMGTITYELLTVIGKRVPRCYLLKDTLVEVRNYLC